MKKLYQTVNSVATQLKSNFPTDVYVVCKDSLTQEQFKEITHLCIDFGVKIGGDVLYSCISVDKKYSNVYHTCRDKKIYTTGRSHSTIGHERILVSYDEFIAFIKGEGVYQAPFNETLKISEDYTAVVTENNIRVGCQTISFDTVEALMRLVKEAKKHNRYKSL